MDRRRRFTEEFRIEAVKQITERGFAVKDVASVLVSVLTVCTSGSSATGSRQRIVWQKRIRPLGSRS